jgi:hypothetical protein
LGGIHLTSKILILFAKFTDKLGKLYLIADVIHSTMDKVAR